MTKTNAKHLRPVEVEWDDDEGVPQTADVPSGQLLRERRDSVGMSHGDLVEGLRLLGADLTGPAVSNWYKGVVPPEHFASVCRLLYPSNKREAQRLHLALLRTAIPEGSLELFDVLVDSHRRLEMERLKEMMRQRARRAARA